MLLILLFEKIKVNNPPLSNLFLHFSLFLPLSYLSESSSQPPNKIPFFLSLAKTPRKNILKLSSSGHCVHVNVVILETSSSILCWPLCSLSRGDCTRAVLVCDLWALGVSVWMWSVSVTLSSLCLSASSLHLSVLLHSVSSLPTGLWEQTAGPPEAGRDTVLGSWNNRGGGGGGRRRWVWS